MKAKPSKSRSGKASAEQTVKNIRRNTRKMYGAEEKIRIVLEGLRGDQTIQELAAYYQVHPNQISQLETGRRRLNVDWQERLAIALECHPFKIITDGSFAKNEKKITGFI